MHEIVIFGAGNIGRSFIGAVFARNGWQVTFVDANRRLVDLLNEAGAYTIKVKQNGTPDEAIRVSGFSALYSDDTASVLQSLSTCSLCATSVGKGALPHVIPVLAEAVKARKTRNLPPLDIIIAENIREGKAYFQEILKENGLSGNEAGLIETSIGKMVPIMNQEDLKDDPLVLHAEPYNTLIVDGKGFRNGIPDIPEIKAVDNIEAWVDRKLFIHNLGHAAAAYLGYARDPDCEFIAEVLDDTATFSAVRNTMGEAAAALQAEYPGVFTQEELAAHIDDLLARFLNRNLGDTVFRVGKDLRRKLNRSDRVVGAIALCLEHDLPCEHIVEAFRAALRFRSEGPSGMFPDDAQFTALIEEFGLDWVVRSKLGIGVKEENLIEVLTGEMASVLQGNHVPSRRISRYSV